MMHSVLKNFIRKGFFYTAEFFAFFCFSAILNADTVPFKINYTDKSPILDGRLDDPAWKNVKFVSFSGDQKTGNKVDMAIVDVADSKKNFSPGKATEFGMFFDSYGLYLGIKCTENDMKNLPAKSDSRDGLFEYFSKDDFIEFFLGDKKSSNYYWFRINPQGCVTDLFSDGDPDVSWNGVCRAAVGHGKNDWTLELYFPFAAFNRIPFRSLDSFSVARFWAASKTRSVYGGTYRKPATWPLFVLDSPGADVLKKLPSFSLKDPELKFLTSTDMAHIDLEIVNNGLSNETVIPLLRIMRPAVSRGFFPNGTGPLSEVEKDAVNIPAGSSVKIGHDFQLKKDEVFVFQLLLGNKEKRLIWSSSDLNLRALKLVDGPGPEFSYYSSESEARLRFSAPAFKNNMHARFSVFSENGKELFSDELKSFEPSFPLKDIPNGRNKIKLDVYGQDGRLLETNEYPLIKLPSAPSGSEVKINRWTQSIVIDGAAFVPVGNSPLVMHGKQYAKSMMKQMAQNNFNAMHLWGGYYKPLKKDTFEFDFDLLKEILDSAVQNKLYFFINISGLVGNNPNSPFTKWHYLRDEKRMELITKLVEFLKGNKFLLGYEIFDEPEYFAAPEWLEAVYNTIKNIDPYHLVVINNCRGARSVIPYLKATDIVGLDYYPIGKAPVATMAGLTDDLKFFAGERPVNWWIQGAKIFNPRAPSPSEIKAMTYIAAAHGASSFFYFIGKPEDELWKAQGESAFEMRELTNALTAESSSPLKVISSESGVYASFRKNGGEFWIIAVNESEEPRSVIIKLPEELKGTVSRIESLFENKRHIDFSGLEIKDSFKPLERHVYVLDGEKVIAE